ncbi:MAG TPA: hypothetical protein DD420_10160 [Streptomyces sp.]|nr:hypothetical protein [Streptomyces sp.]
MSAEFQNEMVYQAYEPVEEVVVHLDRISDGLTSPLDYPVMLHAWPNGHAISVEEVDASLQRLAEAGAVRGLRPGGGAR